MGKGKVNDQWCGFLNKQWEGKRIRKGMGKRGRMPCAKCSCINLYTDSLKYIYRHVHMYTHTAGKLYIHHPKVDSTHSTSPPHIQRYYFHEDSLEQSMDFLHMLQIGSCSFRTSSISHLSETRWWKPSHKPECQEQDVRFCVSGVPREKGNVYV